MDGQVVQFPGEKLTDVAASLRSLARRVEDGTVEARRIVVCIELVDGRLSHAGYGEPMTGYHAAGLCAAVAAEILS